MCLARQVSTFSRSSITVKTKTDMTRIAHHTPHRRCRKMGRQQLRRCVNQATDQVAYHLPAHDVIVAVHPIRLSELIGW